MRHSFAILLALLPVASYAGQPALGMPALGQPASGQSVPGLPAGSTAGTAEEYARAQALVRRTLAGALPASDAVFGFKQTVRMLAHLSRPWKTWNRDMAGSFVVADGGSAFYQADSISSGKTYSSFTFCCDTTLAIINYGENAPSRLTVADKREFFYDVSRLTPVFLLRDFLGRDRRETFLRYVPGAVDSVVYRNDDGQIVSLAIDGGSAQLRSISTVRAHDMYGDVTKTIAYEGYARSEDGRYSYPTRVVESELGIETSVASVGPGTQSFDKGRITAMIPATYRLEPESPKPAPTITSTDFRPDIHLLDLAHTRSRVLVVEFKDVLMVIGAPLAPENGELILRKAREIAPAKPVKYFAFGHHHPHYLGGVRAFVHHGATIVTPAMDTAYLRQIATFPHTLEPDALEKEPRPLAMEVFDKEKVISDGQMEVRLVMMGDMSRHADDFTLFYFPKYKLLYQDELAGIMQDKPVTAAGDRQKGLYNAIVQNGLDVETIVQGWPVGSASKTKSIFEFSELKQSVEMIPPQK